MELQTHLEEMAKSLGAFYFGVGDLSLTRGGPLTPYEKRLTSEYPLAISVGVPLSSETVDRMGDQEDIPALRNYWFHVYKMISPLIDHITSRLTLIIIREGYRALPIPCTQTLDTDNFRGLFSNKLAASLAGLGWIGKSCLLVTPDRGPRVRWGTILTDAPLHPGKPAGVRCGECMVCVEACPVGAFTGRNFEPSEPREMRMQAGRCNQFLRERGRNIGADACGMCVYICPFGKPRSRKG
ncbi:MAG: epoxyqueuosine reductase [Chloroflexi bacterium]|nr:MAG: epoxyqueuosine reductase [Chloroflexota bacterium]